MDVATRVHWFPAMVVFAWVPCSGCVRQLDYTYPNKVFCVAGKAVGSTMTWPAREEWPPLCPLESGLDGRPMPKSEAPLLCRAPSWVIEVVVSDPENGRVVVAISPVTSEGAVPRFELAFAEEGHARWQETALDRDVVFDLIDADGAVMRTSRKAGVLMPGKPVVIVADDSYLNVEAVDGATASLHLLWLQSKGAQRGGIALGSIPFPWTLTIRGF